MKQNLQDKIVVLTGASSGIGREMTKIFVQKYGAKVVGIGRNTQKLQSLQEELGEKFSYRAFDVSERNEWLAFAENLRLEKITPTLLINNAGVFPTFSRVEDTDAETLEKVLKTNFLSAVYGVDALKELIAKEGGIVNICSSAALCTVVGTSSYSASKAAMKAYTEALMLEEKDRYVGLIFPGTTATELFRNDEKTKNSALQIIAMSPKKMAKKIVKKIVKKRKRAIVGWDAKAMNWTAKLAPVWGLRLICKVMELSKSKVFKDVFKTEK